MTATDPDNTEQPVREQLKKTSIQPTDAAAITTPKTLNRKRSHEEIETPTEENRDAKHHARKRSRDSTAEIAVASQSGTSEESDGRAVANGAAKEITPERAIETETLASPKVKRSRVESDNKATADKNGTTNGSLTAKEPPQTSSSAFAASGFGALAANKSSGFGALGGAGLSSFASPKKDSSTAAEPVESAFGRKAPQSDTPSTSVFGGALGAKSAFASTSTTSTSAFGGALGKTGGFGSSGFGSLGGAQLNSFASKPGVSTFSGTKSKPLKAFGAPADDDMPEGDTEDDADDSGVKSPQSVGTDEDKKDSRFYEQKVETGEENEDMVFQGRAKLYTFATGESGKKEWKERGIGNLKLNITKGDTEGKTIARLLMRADGSHRVVLNSPIQKDLKVQSPQGGAPTATGGLLSFYGTIDRKVELLQLKMRPLLAIELYEKIDDLQKQM